MNAYLGGRGGQKTPKMCLRNIWKPPYDILGGDFNSLPESGVIEYIENGEISKSMSFVMSLIKIIS